MNDSFCVNPSAWGLVMLADVAIILESMTPLPVRGLDLNLYNSSPISGPQKHLLVSSPSLMERIDTQKPPEEYLVDTSADLPLVADLSDRIERWVYATTSFSSTSVIRTPRRPASRRFSPLSSGKAGATPPPSVDSSDTYNSEEDDSDDDIALTKMDGANWERNKQRMRKLRTDPSVLFFSRNHVYCNRGCGQIVSLDFRRHYYPDAWNKHKRHCKKGNHPVLQIEEVTVSTCVSHPLTQQKTGNSPTNGERTENLNRGSVFGTNRTPNPAALLSAPFVVKASRAFRFKYSIGIDLVFDSSRSQMFEWRA